MNILAFCVQCSDIGNTSLTIIVSIQRQSLFKARKEGIQMAKSINLLNLSIDANMCLALTAIVANLFHFWKKLKCIQRNFKGN